MIEDKIKQVKVHCTYVCQGRDRIKWITVKLRKGAGAPVNFEIK